MMAEKVIEGKNVEQALKIAAEKYKLPIGKIRYEVISYGSTGIFGLVGAKKAKIKISLPEEKRSRKEAEKSPVTEAETPPVSIQQPVKREIQEERTTSIEQETLSEEIKTTINSRSNQSSEEAIEAGKAALQKILDMITTEASIEVEESDERVLFNVIGGKSAVVIGKRGQTLEAIQYIIEKIINRSSEKRIRLQIDVQGYLKNRKANLEEMAARLAEKAVRVGKPVTVGEMNVHDRKIVHMALKDHKDVRTQSMGSGFYRKLMIFPKKNGGKKREEQTVEAQ
ncbi:MAG: RNA-binding cell elongation regulator Jag/EloR [Desulfobacterales bacterium]|jgi:spoIIIJ-associated protein|nr:RNA-binding cell elongation regulator Jag/EloR [Desulfobacterales bacterium]